MFVNISPSLDGLVTPALEFVADGFGALVDRRKLFVEGFALQQVFQPRCSFSDLFIQVAFVLQKGPLALDGCPCAFEVEQARFGQLLIQFGGALDGLFERLVAAVENVNRMLRSATSDGANLINRALEDRYAGQ